MAHRFHSRGGSITGKGHEQAAQALIFPFSPFFHPWLTIHSFGTRSTNEIYINMYVRIRGEYPCTYISSQKVGKKYLSLGRILEFRPNRIRTFHYYFLRTERNMYIRWLKNLYWLYIFQYARVDNNKNYLFKYNK